MDSTTIKTFVESVAGPLIAKALEARPDNGYGYGIALAAALVACLILGGALGYLYVRSSKQSAAQSASHIATLNKQLKEQAVSAEKVQAIEARLNEHKGENSDRLYQLQLTEIEKRDSTRDHIVGILDNRFDALQARVDTRVGSLESRLGACQDAINNLDKVVLVMKAESKNKPPKEGG
jgi:uncharacterized coiled-coil protein SlyX